MTERRCVRDIHAYNGRIAPIIGRNRLNPPARLAALFILLAGTPVIALGWLGWRLLHQEDLLERQRDRERLESAAALITLQLNRSLARWEQLLQDPQSSTLPEGSALLRFDARGVVNSVGRALPYFPAVHPPAPLDLSRFAAAETYEFQTEDFDKAAATYRALAANSTLSVRAAALMRLARCLRKQNRLRQAIAVYAELASMGHTTVGGDPAELLARREQVGLLKATGDDFGAAREAQLLSQALRRGQFVIDRPTFEFYNNSSPAPHSLAAELSDAVDMAEAVIALWPRWLEQPSGRASLMSGTHAYASVWGIRR